MKKWDLRMSVLLPALVVFGLDYQPANRRLLLKRPNLLSRIQPLIERRSRRSMPSKRRWTRLVVLKTRWEKRQSARLTGSRKQHNNSERESGGLNHIGWAAATKSPHLAVSEAVW